MMNKVRNTILRYDMLKSGEKVLVGLSGGADSVALLLILKELGFTVSACHVNHQLRGTESERDQKFCEELCNRENIRLFVEKIDVITFCKENKVGTEEGARLLRYQVLQKYSKGSKIATAHNVNDRIETTLINLTRGTALRGLCSIPPVRDNIVRPFIDCTREEIEDYLREKKQDFVTDSTNMSTEYTRNKIRHIVIPELLKINPNLYNNYKNTINIISNEDGYLDKISDEVLSRAKTLGNEYNCETILSQDDVIIKRCIAKMLKENNLECSNKKVIEVLDIIKNGGKINLSGDVYAVSKKGRISICTIKQKEKYDFEIKAEINKTYRIYGKTIKLCKQNVNQVEKSTNINKKFANMHLDYDKIQGAIILRNRRSGDRVKFAGKTFTSSIKKLFNKDVPLEKRDEVIFLEDEGGIIFVEGYGVSERVSVTNNTKNVLCVKILEGIKSNG